MTYTRDPRREEEEKKRMAARDRIARSQIQEQQMAAKQGVNPVAQSRVNPLQAAGKKLLGSAASSALGPLGPLAGLFFNTGGAVPMQGYNDGGWLSALFGRLKGQNPNRQKMEEEARRRQQAGQQSLAQQINFGNAARKNMGGPISANPNGYNEGGSVQETPLKKVMDEDKIELARMAAMKAEERKDKKFAAEEARAQEKHTMDMKMKKQAAVTKKAPLASK